MKRPELLSCLVLLASVALVHGDGVIIKNEHEDKNVEVSTGKYRIPDPFDLKSLDSKRMKDEFYYFKSTQTSFEAQKRSRKLVVEEYFSLGLGLSYSLHRDLDHPNEEWAIIGDSSRSRFYVVRNPHAENPDELDCELDHAHNHRQVFPWQFIYAMKPDKTDESGSKDGDDSEKSRKKKKNSKKEKKEKVRTAFVYGVGAIWMNAISLDARSDLVGEQSSYPDSNSWFVTGGNRLRVELLFDKLNERRANRLKDNPEAYQAKLDKTPLNSVRVDRRGVVEKPLVSNDPTSTADNELEFIQLNKYGSELTREIEPELEHFFVVLEKCRASTKTHRLFPSLLRSLSTSASQHYQMHYIVERFPLYKEADGRRAEGQFDEKKHRYTNSIEFVTEVFSLAHESQTKIYTPLPFDGAGPGSGRTDVFIARFTERANNQRSSRHSTAHYHIIENESDDSEPQCKVGEHEPLPAEHLFLRSLTFKRAVGEDQKSTIDYHGHLTGLGALLMNAADFHYKSFSLTGKSIRVAQNPNDLKDYREAKVDEWRLEDKKLGWSIHFFVEKRDPEREKLTLDLTDRARGDLSRLVRIDIRDLRTVDMSADLLDTENGANAPDDDANPSLLLQFTVSRIEFQTEEDDIEFLVTPPSACKAGGDAALDDDSEPNYDSASDSDQDFFFDDSENEDYFSGDEDFDDDSSKPDEEKLHFNQEQGEEFELEPGMMHEDLEMPSFFDFMEGRYAYEMSTKIVFDQDDDEDEDEDEHKSSATFKSRKGVWLREIVDLEHENAMLHIYDSDEAYQLDRRTESYYIFYESELVFRVANGRCKHSSDIEDGKWLRLFSAPFNYYTIPNIKGQKVEKELMKNKALIERSSINMYGVGALWRRASESEFAAFWGKKRKLVEIDGHKYRELVWNYEEHEMGINFHFLQDLTRIEDDKKSKRGRPAHEYLSLHSIELKNVFAPDQFQVNSFGSIRAQVAPYNIMGPLKYLGEKMMIPAICEDQYVEAQRMREQTIDQVKAPTFFDHSIGKATSYEMSYTISHRLSSTLGDIKLGETAVREVFDRSKKLGRISSKTGDSNSDYFIDGANKRIYSYSDENGVKNCAIVAPKKIALALGIPLEFDGNPDFDPNKMYGLASLWNELAKLEGSLRVHFLGNRRGRKEEVHTYTYHLQGSSAKHDRAKTVTMLFRKKRDDLQLVDASSRVVDGNKARSQEELVLSLISVDPPIEVTKFKGKKKPDPVRSGTDLQVTYMKDGAKLDWQLPSECEALDVPAPDNAGNEPDTGRKKPVEEPEPSSGKFRQFPKIEGLVARLLLFHMKSEVSVRGKIEKVYFLEEWSHNNHLRMRSHGLGKAARKDFDFIIYESSKEHFDLSQPFSCKSNRMPEPPLELNVGKEFKSNLIEVWCDDEALINHLSNTYYSPLTLWRMAGKPGVRKQLVAEVEIAPRPLVPKSAGDGELDKLVEFELGSESWQVEAPRGGPFEWSYRMNFMRKSRVFPDGKEEIFHTLESITLDDVELGALGTKEAMLKPFSVSIEVANYERHARADDILDKFLLPEGWGCARAPEFLGQVASYDELRLFNEDNWLLSYEASLQLFDDKPRPIPDLSPLDMEPESQLISSLSGVFLRSGAKTTANQPEMDMAIHHTQIHYRDGHAISRGTLFDRSKSVEYHVDKAYGLCTVEKLSISGWRLEFPKALDKVHNGHTVNLLIGDLKGSLFETLFLDTSSSLSDTAKPEFPMLNKFTTGGKAFHTSYERHVNYLELTKDLFGPARIVRKFSHAQFRLRSQIDKKGGGKSEKLIIKWNDELATRVFLFDQTETKLQAVLDIHLQRGPEPNLSQLLRSAKVRLCYDEGQPLWDEQVRTFTLDYEMKSNVLAQMVSAEEMIRDHFYDRLMRAVDLLPLQLDGAAQIEAKHDLLHIHFSVMDAPTSYLYLQKTDYCTMDEQMEAKSESRYAPTLLDCSLWCDQTNCAAMSYRADRVCRVVTARAVFGKSVRSLSSNKSQPQTLNEEQLRRLSDCRKDYATAYYFQKRPRPRPTLARFRQFMERAVNQERDSGLLTDLSIGTPSGFVAPIAFYEYSELFRGRSDPVDDPIEADEVVTQNGSEKIVTWNQAKYTFELLARDKKLELDETELNADGLKFKIMHVNTVNDGECYDTCQRYNCMLLSHCYRNFECTLVVADKSSVDIKPIENGLVDAKTCSVHVRDRTSSFQMYENTKAPKEADKRVEDVSKVVCAAMCHIAEEQCLSFDYCTYIESSPTDDDTRRSICMMQKSHVSEDTFDRSLLSPEPDSQKSRLASNLVGNETFECDHYSKNLLLDFKQLPNQRVKQRERGLLRGFNEEHCARFCIGSDQCQAFEFCRDERRDPPQSCRFLREDHLRDTSPASQDQKSQLSQILVSSSTCSIYMARDFVQVERLERIPGLVGGALGAAAEQAGSTSFSSKLLRSATYFLAAILLGAIVQFIHIKLTNRALVFKQQVFL